MDRPSYRITVKGRLSDRFASAFDGVRHEPGVGTSVLVGALDQSQLIGLLRRLSDFGIELVGVEEISE